MSTLAELLATEAQLIFGRAVHAPWKTLPASMSADDCEVYADHCDERGYPLVAEFWRQEARWKRVGWKRVESA